MSGCASLKPARQHGAQAAKITRLMGCLCFTKRLQSSPYADLLAEGQWDVIAQEFVRQCCGLMGLVSTVSDFSTRHVCWQT